MNLRSIGEGIAAFHAEGVSPGDVAKFFIREGMAAMKRHGITAIEMAAFVRPRQMALLAKLQRGRYITSSEASATLDAMIKKGGK